MSTANVPVPARNGHSDPGPFPPGLSPTACEIARGRSAPPPTMVDGLAANSNLGPHSPDADSLTGPAQAHPMGGTPVHGEVSPASVLCEGSDQRPGRPPFSLAVAAIAGFPPSLEADVYADEVDRVLQIIANETMLPTAQDQHLDNLRRRLSALGYYQMTVPQLRKRLRELISPGGLPTVGGGHGQSFGPSAGESYFAVEPAESSLDCGLYSPSQRENGLPTRLSNFVVEFERDVAVHDGHHVERRFEGEMRTAEGTSPISIPAKTFAKENDLLGALFDAGGPKVQIYGSISQIRTAISGVSNPTIERVTTEFGWQDDSRYLVPSGMITADGFLDRPLEYPRVDLSRVERASKLDFRRLDPADLDRVKRHIVDDFVLLNEPRVTYSMLATVALAVLYRFTDGLNRFAPWLTGDSGVGKSFLAKLTANFFGDFPLRDGEFVTWNSTPNYIQRVGHFFRDAIYPVDDYKPELMKPEAAVRVMQGYGDSTGRGRLNADATTNTTREIRGWLLCTAESIPDHSASSIARSIVILMRAARMDLERGRRCLAERSYYSGVTADFIRFLLAENRIPVFRSELSRLQEFYYRDIVGQQNDIRIAGNFAMLAAAFGEMAQYLAPVWPAWQGEVERFVIRDSVALRNDMLGCVREQQACEIFLGTLRDLVENRHVTIDGWLTTMSTLQHSSFAKVVGRLEQTPSGHRLFAITTSLALEEVNGSLVRQGRSGIKITPKALLDQLHQGGYLVDQAGRCLTRDSAQDLTRQTTIGGRNLRAFRVPISTILPAESDRCYTAGMGPPVGGGS